MIFEIVKIGLSVLSLGFLIGAWIAINALIANTFDVNIDTLISVQLLLGILTMLGGRDVFIVIVTVFLLMSIGVLGVYLAVCIANYIYEKLKKEIKT